MQEDNSSFFETKPFFAKEYSYRKGRRFKTLNKSYKVIKPLATVKIIAIQTMYVVSAHHPLLQNAIF